MQSAIEVLVQLNHASLEPQKESTVYLMLKIAGNAGEDYDRPGLNLDMVMDRSGSMDGDKIAYTHEGTVQSEDSLGQIDGNLVVLGLLHSARPPSDMPPSHEVVVNFNFEIRVS